MDRITLAKEINKVSSLTGQFTLRSGQISDRYFDKYRFESNPALLRAIANHLAPLIPDGTDVLAGLEMGGIPIATMLSQVSGLPCAFVRKEAKAYGTCQLAEGCDIKRKRILIVEDVITSGGQVILSAADLRALDAHIEDVICVIDREQGGGSKLKAAGLNMHALFTRSELEASIGGLSI